MTAAAYRIALSAAERIVISMISNGSQSISAADISLSCYRVSGDLGFSPFSLLKADEPCFFMCLTIPYHAITPALISFEMPHARMLLYHGIFARIIDIHCMMTPLASPSRTLCRRYELS